MLPTVEKFADGRGLKVTRVKNGVVNQMTRTTRNTVIVSIAGSCAGMRNHGLTVQDRGDIRI